MPDPVKLASLKQAGYRIIPTCSICMFGEFKPGSPWGSCTTIRYQHQKHTGSKPASAYASGHCSSFAIRSSIVDDLTRSGFQGFLDEKAAES